MGFIVRLITNLAIVVALLTQAGALEGQVLNAPSRLSSTSEPGVYEQLLIKSRGRHLGGQVSPSGELYLYIDDFDLQSANLTSGGHELSPVLLDTDGVRRISLAVVSHVPQNLRIDPRQGSDLEIGVIHLPEERGARRPIETDSVIDLAPLQVRGSGGANRERLFNEGVSFLSGGGQNR